mmetsp:Transcript_42941/g.100863  ORF Transcript_42941/g.100863 Transcript_42941/m.100863 type:complete len:433 (-) Transcript_42941:304-1602(-)
MYRVSCLFVLPLLATTESHTALAGHCTVPADEGCQKDAVDAQAVLSPNALLQVASRPLVKRWMDDADSLSSEQGPLWQFAAPAVLRFDAQAPNKVSKAPLSEGLVVVRVPKTGSSTLQSLAKRLGDLYGMTFWKQPYILAKNARNIVTEKNVTTVSANASRTLQFSRATSNTSLANVVEDRDPIVYAAHGALSHVAKWLETVLPKAFRTAMVREPAERCMSSFYHLFEGQQGTVGMHDDSAKIAFLTGDCDFFETVKENWLCNTLKCPGFMTQYLEPYNNASYSDIIEAFDFIGVTERFDESMIILGKKLGLPLTDMLYVTVKESNADHDCQSIESTANTARIPVSEESEAVQAAAALLRKGQDMRLVNQAHAALDAAILSYGESAFNTDLARFRVWLNISESECRCVGYNKMADDAFDCISDLVAQRGWSA